MGRPGGGWVMVMPMEVWLSPWLLGLLGLVIGSFLNVVIHRLPQLLEREQERVHLYLQRVGDLPQDGGPAASERWQDVSLRAAGDEVRVGAEEPTGGGGGVKNRICGLTPGGGCYD